MKLERDAELITRDDIILRADVYRPDDGGPHPSLLVRTPYGKGIHEHDPTYDFARFVAAGFIVICQDVRGRHASDGHWESFMHPDKNDSADGFDSVEWAARLPGASGAVGTYGASYDGFVQWRTASARPPSLVAMSAQSIPARYPDLEGPGTIRPGRRLHWWITKMAPEYRRRSDTPGTKLQSEGEAAWNAGEAANWLNFLPWLELPQAAFEDDTEAVKAWLRAPDTDPWQLDAAMRDITVPNLDFTGWFDHASGDFGTFKAIVRDGGSEDARLRSRIVIGPWGHNGYIQSRFGAIDFGGSGLFDGVGLMIRWFDYWLKGVPNGIDGDPRVLLYVMGDDQWRGESAWPLVRARDQTLHTSSGGHANTPAGDGVLLMGGPVSSASDSYVYDPRNPVPDLYGLDGIRVPADQGPLAHRLDILVYQTPPLEERMEVTGNPFVELVASSSAPDTDFVARLVDVSPDGLARDVAMGVVRARYRNGVDRPRLVPAGETMTYRIQMSATSNAFLPGHRIRLDITSSCFPSYDRNHNTAADQNADGELRPAIQTVIHGGRQGTRLVLPRIPPDSTAREVRVNGT